MGNQVNERQVVLRKGGNFTAMDDYMDKVVVKKQPWDEAYVLTAAANAVLVLAATTLTGFIYIDGSNAASGDGDIPAPAVAGFTAGTAANSVADLISDTYGNILNQVEIRDASTHDPIMESGRQVFALIQSATGSADHAAVVTTGASENLQLSFFYIASDGTLTATVVTDTIEFHINQEYKLRNTAVIEMEGSGSAADVLEDVSSWSVSTFTVTTATSAGASVLTLADGSLTNGGASTQAGDTITMGAIGTFNKNTFLGMDNGVEMLKATDVSFSSAGNITIARQLDIGDVITVRDKA